MHPRKTHASLELWTTRYNDSGLFHAHVTLNTPESAGLVFERSSLSLLEALAPSGLFTPATCIGLAALHQELLSE